MLVRDDLDKKVRGILDGLPLSRCESLDNVENAALSYTQQNAEHRRSADSVVLGPSLMSRISENPWSTTAHRSALVGYRMINCSVHIELSSIPIPYAK